MADETAPFDLNAPDQAGLKDILVRALKPYLPVYRAAAGFPDDAPNTVFLLVVGAPSPRRGGHAQWTRAMLNNLAAGRDALRLGERPPLSDAQEWRARAERLADCMAAAEGSETGGKAGEREEGRRVGAGAPGSGAGGEGEDPASGVGAREAACARAALRLESEALPLLDDWFFARDGEAGVFGACAAAARTRFGHTAQARLTGYALLLIHLAAFGLDGCAPWWAASHLATLPQPVGKGGGEPGGGPAHAAEPAPVQRGEVFLAPCLVRVLSQPGDRQFDDPARAFGACIDLRPGETVLGRGAPSAQRACTALDGAAGAAPQVGAEAEADPDSEAAPDPDFESDPDRFVPLSGLAWTEEGGVRRFSVSRRALSVTVQPAPFPQPADGETGPVDAPGAPADAPDDLVEDGSAMLVTVHALGRTPVTVYRDDGRHRPVELSAGGPPCRFVASPFDACETTIALADAPGAPQVALALRWRAYGSGGAQRLRCPRLAWHRDYAQWLLCRPAVRAAAARPGDPACTLRCEGIAGWALKAGESLDGVYCVQAMEALRRVSLLAREAGRADEASWAEKQLSSLLKLLKDGLYRRMESAEGQWLVYNRLARWDAAQREGAAAVAVADTRYATNYHALYRLAKKDFDAVLPAAAPRRTPASGQPRYVLVSRIDTMLAPLKRIDGPLSFRLVKRLGAAADPADLSGAGVFAAEACDVDAAQLLPCVVKLVAREDVARNEWNLLASYRSHPMLPEPYAYGHVTAVEGGKAVAYGAIVMEFVRGESLDRLVARIAGEGGGASLESTLGLVEPLARFLSVISTARPPLVHRDIKPGNILVERTGARVQLRLIDLGFSAQRAPGAAASPRGATPLYAPPELANPAPGEAAGAHDDVRIDTYGLAATMFSLLTGLAPAGTAALDPKAVRHNAGVVSALAKGVRAAVASYGMAFDGSLAQACAEDALREMDTEVAELVTRSLSARPADRPTPREFYDALPARYVDTLVLKAERAYLRRYGSRVREASGTPAALATARPSSLEHATMRHRLADDYRYDDYLADFHEAMDCWNGAAYGKARPLLQRLAEAGDPTSQYCLGVCLRDGLGGAPGEPVDVFVWWMRAAKAGHVVAAHNVGWCYETGFGLPAGEASAAHARTWYGKAAAQGFPAAKERLEALPPR